jgi:hypothetical protein
MHHPLRERNKCADPSPSERALGVHAGVTPIMGIGLWVLSPPCEIGISKRSVYQMTASGEKARFELQLAIRFRLVQTLE